MSFILNDINSRNAGRVYYAIMWSEASFRAMDSFHEHVKLMWLTNMRDEGGCFRATHFLKDVKNKKIWSFDLEHVK